jgi:hypothetical protein
VDNTDRFLAGMNLVMNLDFMIVSWDGDDGCLSHAGDLIINEIQVLATK